MPEHWIRLRGGWEAVDLDDSLAVPIRIALPLSSTEEKAHRLQLRRRFGRPALDPQGESLWLRIDRVGGLYRLELNNRELPVAPAASGPIEIPLRTISDRNELVLEACFEPSARARETCAGGWGEIALLIRPRADDQDRPLA
jgi:hypothetical protein